MDTTQNQADAEAFFQYLENFRLSFNAHKKFNDIINSLDNAVFTQNNEIFRLLDTIVLEPDSQFSATLSTNTILYRAREISIEDYKRQDTGLSISIEDNHYTTNGYNSENSVEAPIGITPQGRNNIAGVSYFYAASDPVTACTEIKSSLRSLISLAEFIICKDLHIIDFSKDVAFEHELSKQYDMSFGEFFGLLMFSFSKPETTIYRFTQIIADHLRKTGIDGLAYRSFYTGKTNYTIFNSHKNNIKFQNSRIVSHHFTNEIFWDFNNADTLKSCDEKECNYDNIKADKILKDLQMTFRSK